MQDIGREADLSPGAAYRYFSSKEEIIEACCEECYRNSVAMIDEAVQNGDPLRVLNELLEATFAELQEPEAGGILQVEVQAWCEALRSPRISESLRRVTDQLWKTTLVRLLRRAQELEQIGPHVDPEAMAMIMVSLRQGLVLQMALDPGVDVAAYVQGMRDVLGSAFAVAGADG